MERKFTSTTLVLASASPRRRDLLAAAGLSFETILAEIEEISGSDIPARELCLINAELKARDVANRFPERVVLGADTVVSLDGAIFGKPRDLGHAREMLGLLAGRTHEVFTGVCLAQRDSGKLLRLVEVTRVHFRPEEEVDLDAYLQEIHTLDKAGAYAAQEDNGRLIECMEGPISNVIGLPIERVMAALRESFPETLPKD